MSAPKSEAERRLDRFLNAADVLGVRVSMNAKEATALFSAIFDPLPEPEPEPVKTLGQVLRDTMWPSHEGCAWSDVSERDRDNYERTARALIAAHEARRPKPTVDEVAVAMRRGRFPDCVAWTQIDPYDRDRWLDAGRAVFPLFGVQP